jgi:hypothetical protein
LLQRLLLVLLADSTTDGAYGFDRWRIFASNGTTTYSAQTFTAGNAIPNQEPKNFARLVTSGQTLSTAASILQQRIEDVRTSAGQQVTVSFWAKAASGTPKVSVELVQGFGFGGSADVNTYINQVTLSTSWVRYTVTGVLPSISGKTIGDVYEAPEEAGYLALHLWVSGGSTYNSRTGSLGIQSNTFDFWGVQLEAGPQATPFEQRPIGVELALCQRYYALLASGPGSHIGVGFYMTATHVYIQSSAPVPMRASPTIAVVSGTNYYGSINVGYAVDYLNTFIIDRVSADNRWILLYNNVQASATAGYPSTVRGADDAAYVAFNAEL